MFKRTTLVSLRISCPGYPERPRTSRRRCRPVWKSTSASGVPGNSSLNHFSAMTRPRWLRRAARNRHRHAIEQALRRWRGGRRFDSARTRRKILISTHPDDAAQGSKERGEDDYIRAIPENSVPDHDHEAGLFSCAFESISHARLSSWRELLAFWLFCLNFVDTTPRDTPGRAVFTPITGSTPLLWRVGHAVDA